MRVPRYDIHEIAIPDPKGRFKGEEFGPCLIEEGFLIFRAAEGGDARSGLLVAEEAPEGGAFVRGDGAVGPGCDCWGRLVFEAFKKGVGQEDWD